MDARPDQEEMDEATNNFLLLLEKQEKKGFEDLANTLSQLPKPTQGFVRSMSAADAVKASFLPAPDKDHTDSTATCSLRRIFACTNTRRISA